MAWFKKTRKPIKGDAARSVPEGVWVKCPGCRQVIYNKDLADNLQVCPKCAHHFRLSATERLASLFDGGTWYDVPLPEVAVDPLKFLQRVQDEAGAQARIDEIRPAADGQHVIPLFQGCQCLGIQQQNLIAGGVTGQFRNLNAVDVDNSIFIVVDIQGELAFRCTIQLEMAPGPDLIGVPDGADHGVGGSFGPEATRAFFPGMFF